MKKWVAAGVLFCLSMNVRAQLQDDFSDGDLTNDPSWLGQTDLFQVENEELRLLDPDPGSGNLAFLYLAAPTSIDSPTTWEWYVRLDFAPSSSNYARLYLQASGPDLSGPQWGYFLRVGGISGDGDALELFRQDGTATELLLSGTAGALGAAPAQARIRVLRSTAGEWTLYADYSGGQNLQWEGSAIDTTYPHGLVAGLACIYTSTRSDDFYFDDVWIDPLYVDQSPPHLMQVEALDPVRVRALFDEPLEEASATDSGHYAVSGGIGMPSDVFWDPGLPGEVVLLLSDSLQPAQTYTLEVSQVSDVAGNLLLTQSWPFSWTPPQPVFPLDVLITEIMADPNPPVALPDAEYLELYNRTENSLQLEGWEVSDGGTPAVFPSFQLGANQFLILCNPENEALLAPFGVVLGLDGFPGLNNSGDRLVLRDAEGQLIHQVAYDPGWYGESDKDDGGWSLELINPLAPCESAANWKASENLLGGTPGQKNSLWLPEPDTLGPSALRIFPESPTTGVITFSEAMDPDAVAEPAHYAIDGGIVVTEAYPSEEDPAQVFLKWSPSLTIGSRYTLTFTPGLTDCVGNAVPDAEQLVFGLPEPIAEGDIVINEILFQPEVGGAEFVEWYNRSGKVLNAGAVILGNIQGSSDSIAPVQEDRLLLPGEYLVLCERPGDLPGRYASAQPRQILKNPLPALPDGGGNVTLYTEGNSGEVVVIDAVDYSPDWHHPFLQTTRGVSLERIDPWGASHSPANWHSAAAQAGYATPTAPNSQLFRVPEGEAPFSMPYSVFSPDGDGVADFLLLQYELENSGWTATVRIFDAWGRLVNQLAQNELLATSGTFLWKGEDQNGGKARMGIYILWIQLVHPEGKVKVQKLTCVLAGRL
ncbi:MAG: lamin tail domain-containing protein [Lewinellaceae bacterium]|nr:lamin tail domain-containing protein [Lewinellaceae bacterium]